jgi:hypothetical protein
MRVLELQQRGALHVHAIVIGWSFVPVPVLSALQVANGFGSRVNLSEIRSAEGLSRYLVSAYLAKSHETLGRAYRVVQCSRGFPRPAPYDADGWGPVLNAVDPSAPAIPAGMSWWEWAEWVTTARRTRDGRMRAAVATRGDTWIDHPPMDPFALVRPTSRDGPGLFDPVEVLDDD